MGDEQLYFDPIKVLNGSYYVEYRPPAASSPFATVLLTFVKDAALEDVATAVEEELAEWTDRYPVAVMVSAFDPADNLYHLQEVRPWDHLVGYVDPATQEVHTVWGSVPDDQFPKEVLDSEYLRRIYSDVPFRTAREVQREARRHARSIRLGVLVVVAWVTGGSLLLALADFISPRWLSAIMFAFALWKAYVKGMQMLGKRRKSPKEEAADAEQLRMRHHHFHCEQNPEAFRKLRSENFERSAREEIQEEARRLASGGSDAIAG